MHRTIPQVAGELAEYESSYRGFLRQTATAQALRTQLDTGSPEPAPSVGIVIKILFTNIYKYQLIKLRLMNGAIVICIDSVFVRSTRGQIRDDNNNRRQKMSELSLFILIPARAATISSI